MVNDYRQENFCGSFSQSCVVLCTTKKRKRHYLKQHSFVVFFFILFIFISLNAMSSQFKMMVIKWRDARADADIKWKTVSLNKGRLFFRKSQIHKTKKGDAYYIIYDNELIKIIRGFVACQKSNSTALYQKYYCSLYLFHCQRNEQASIINAQNVKRNTSSHFSGVVLLLGLMPCATIVP